MGNWCRVIHLDKEEKWLIGVGAEYSFISGFSCR